VAFEYEAVERIQAEREAFEETLFFTAKSEVGRMDAVAGSVVCLKR
jgi:hypothetical protein